jgi:hypothetical protein
MTEDERELMAQAEAALGEVQGDRSVTARELAEMPPAQRIA